MCQQCCWFAHYHVQSAAQRPMGGRRGYVCYRSFLGGSVLHSRLGLFHDRYVAGTFPSEALIINVGRPVSPWLHGTTVSRPLSSVVKTRDIQTHVCSRSSESLRRQPQQTYIQTACCSDLRTSSA